MAYLHSARPEETDPTRVSIIELTVRQLEKQIAELQEIIAALEMRAFVLA